MGISPSRLSMLDSGIKPCKQQAKQKSCRTESENMLLVLDSSNMFDKVGNALVSTWDRASVMQYSEVRGGKSDAESVDRRSGILLTRKERRIVVAWRVSFRKFALARISNAARTRSTIVDCMSPYTNQSRLIFPAEVHLPGIDYASKQRWHCRLPMALPQATTPQ